MAEVTLERSVEKYNRKFENLKINVKKNPDQQAELFTAKHGRGLYQARATESWTDRMSSYSSPEEYPLIIDPHGYVVPSKEAAIYTGVPNYRYEYIEYPIEGPHYYNPMVDFTYIHQPMHEDWPATGHVHYTSQQTNDGYVYGSSQLYSYSTHLYYGQDPQDEATLMQNAHHKYCFSGPIIPTGQTSFAPSESVPVHVPVISYPLYPHHALRACAPSWIDNSAEKVETRPQWISSKGKPTLVKGATWKRRDTNITKDSQIIASSIALLDDSMGGNESKGKKIEVDSKDFSADLKRQNDVKAAQNEKVMNVLALPTHGNGVKENSTLDVTKSSNEEVGLCIPYGGKCCSSSSEEFSINYDDARFFIIKSYSEENVYQAIQHGVWASTPKGNKKLDDAYHEAQRGMGKSGRCPVFLFFSVNGSRQFCGVAEMTGPVNYKKSMEFWQQQKWSGSFPVTWHVVKDVPNSLFRRVILQNNENKPATNSRDTQEVFLSQGVQMLNIMKNYSLKTSILDEFGYSNQHLLKKPVELRLQQQKSSLQSFKSTGLKAQCENITGLKALNPTNKLCGNGHKSKEASIYIARQLVAKPLHIAERPDLRLDKDAKRADKESIKFIATEVLVAS